MERLGRYTLVQRSLDTIPLELERLRSEAQAIRSGLVCNGVKTSRDRGERLLNNMMQRQRLEWMLRDAEQWVQVTDLALSALEKNQRQILESLYIRKDKKATQLEAELGMEHSTLYRHREKALERFTLALLGSLDS